MKTKLFRAISLGLVLASILGLVSPYQAYADDGDQAAVGIIASCKNFVGPVAAGTDCDTYRKCVAGQTAGDAATCTRIKDLNGVVPQLPAAAMTDCGAASRDNSAADCKNAWVACIALNIKDNKITDEARNNCSNLVSEGKLAEAQVNPNADKSKTSCVIDGIGWIVCPVVGWLAKIVDGAYTFVSAMLTVQPLYTAGGNADNKEIREQVYTYWSVMRNFANVAFVIAFMVIIFSQVTSVGINNYGIKKMLPRLIIAAILVNISYWICAALVDISNILGTSIYDVLKVVDIKPPSGSAFGSTGDGWTGLTEKILAGSLITGVALYVGLSALAPILITILIAILTVVIVLSLRQALIILLVIISPLAFVAYLLPNTEEWFKRWRSTFQMLLLMFPIISLIFAASGIASQIVMATAPTDNQGIKIAVQIVGASIGIIPLFITPVVMKSASGILSTVGAFVNNPNKGPFDRMRKGAEGYRNNRQEYRQLKALNGYRTLPGKGVAARRSASRQAILNNRKSELNRSQASYVAGLAESNDGFRDKLAQGGGDGANMRALASAINVQAELQAKEVKAASAVIEHMNLSSSDLNKLAMGGGVTGASGRTLSGADDAVRKAALQEAVAKGTVGDIEQIITGTDASGAPIVPGAAPRTDSQNKVLSDAIAKSGIANKATHLAGQTIDDIAQGNVASNADLDRVMARAIEGGKYSAEKLADNDKDSLKRLDNLLKTPGAGGASAAKVAAVKQQAAKALTDARISGRITDAQRPLLQSIR